MLFFVADSFSFGDFVRSIHVKWFMIALKFQTMKQKRTFQFKTEETHGRLHLIIKICYVVWQLLFGMFYIVIEMSLKNNDS